MKNKFLVLFMFLFIGLNFSYGVELDSTQVVIDSTIIDSTTITNPVDGETPEKGSFWTLVFTVILPGVFGSLAVLFSDAAKYIGTSQWSWKTFMSTKIKPFLMATLVSTLAAITQFFFPEVIDVLPEWGTLEIDGFVGYFSLASVIGMLTAIFDGFLKKKATSN